ncbi:MAG: hypothetical protein M1828_001642 [Chrysothrix sp. TS-e1954]|nr:MAG: hypothetical protein M1828_001642 [Chrysothrix sp. TS-e1954]
MTSKSGLAPDSNQGSASGVPVTTSSWSTTTAQEGDERTRWTSQFADADVNSTEIQVLHKEGDHLLEILAKAFPDDKRNTWTFDTLRAAVLQRQQEWQSKPRVGSGRPQQLFHSLMEKFDSYSNLCAIIPSGDKYISLATGAISILVKASAEHSKTITQLSEALDIITDAAAICEAQSKLIRSKTMQNTIAKFYIAVFLFFGDAAKWYHSRSIKKIINSLHNDFSETFRNSLANIQRLATETQNVTALGSAAELREVRLSLEELQEDMHDFRIGQSGQLRMLAEYMRLQHEVNVEQHQKTQDMVNAFGQQTLAAPPDHRHFQEGDKSPLPLGQSQSPSVSENTSSNSSSEENDIIDFIKAPIAQADRSSASASANSSTQVQCSSASPADDSEAQYSPIEGSPLASLISTWTISFDPSILYANCGMLVRSQSQIDATMAHISRFCQHPGREIASFQPKGDIDTLDPVTGVAQLMADLAYRIIMTLDEAQRDEVSSQTLIEKANATDISVDLIVQQLAIALDIVAPSSDLYILAIEVPSAWDGSICFELLINALRHATSQPLSPLKVLIMSTSSIDSLTYYLRDNEINSLEAIE